MSRSSDAYTDHVNRIGNDDLPSKQIQIEQAVKLLITNGFTVIPPVVETTAN